MEYQIGDFSKIARLSVTTLRFYHENGLLEPSFVDPESGYRYYSENALEKAKIIQELKELGFPLREIQFILDSYQDDAELLTHLIERYREICENIEKSRVIRDKLAFYIQQLKENGEVNNTSPTPQLITKKVPDTLIASVRYKGKYNDIGKYLGELYKHYGRYVAGPPMALYYDEGYKEEDADIEAGLPVKRQLNVPGIENKVLKGGEVLAAIHRGAYEALGESYKAMIDYINLHHLKMHLPCLEIYLKGPGIIFPRSPKKLLTEIRMPIEG